MGAAESSQIEVAEYEAGYFLSHAARRFVATHQTPSTDITGQTSFAATTPTFLLTGENVSLRLVLNSITLSQVGAVAGGVISIAIAVDTANRYSSGGTSVTPQNLNTSSTTPSVWTVRTGATASAAGAGTRYVMAASAPASLGASLTLRFKDEIILQAAGTQAGKFTGSLAIYTWAASTGPSWKFSLDWTEGV